jgi:hypothetical protein
MVIFGHWSFSFEDLDQDSGLIISISGESLSFFSGNGGISWDQSGHNTTSGLNT